MTNFNYLTIHKRCDQDQELTKKKIKSVLTIALSNVDKHSLSNALKDKDEEEDAIFF